MAEQKNMTTQEYLYYLEGQMKALKTTVIPAIINKTDLETRQTLAAFFLALDDHINPDAPEPFRLGATECLHDIAKLIETLSDH